MLDHSEADTIVRKVPSSWETNSEGRSALLRAARDADDAALNEITLRVRKFGFGDMDVNVADSSGRVSYNYPMLSLTHLQRNNVFRTKRTE